MTRINLPTALATSAAALLLASAAMAQTGVATPRDNPGQTVTAPTGDAGAAPATPKLGDANGTRSLDADEVRARTQERMKAEAAANASQGASTADSTKSATPTSSSGASAKTLDTRDADARPTVDDSAASNTGTAVPLDGRDADGTPVMANDEPATGTKTPLNTRDADGTPVKVKEGS